MVAPLIAAAVRAAAKNAVSNAAKTAVRKSAENSITKRAVSAASKRYLNASGRYMAEAEKVGKRTRYGQMLVKAAQRTKAFSVELDRADISKGASTTIENLVNDSSRYTVRAARTKEARGNLLGETLLNGTMQGHRLFAVTRSLWDDDDYANRYDALREKFDGRNVADIILLIEKETGVNIMRGDINEKSRYGNLTREEIEKIMLWVLENYG